MPAGIEMLTRLEELSYVVRNKKDYIGGTSDSSGIGELADLNSLRELTIIYLHNVRGKIDAERAKLKDKQNFQKLYLKWVQKEEEELAEEEEVANSSKVLEGLRPHPNLELLSIKYFGGAELPKWMGFSHCLPNLVKLYLEDCKSCEKLPALGMLPHIRVLHILQMRSVKCLGEEFYYQHQGGGGESSMITLFPSLIQLKIHKMNDLVVVAPPPPHYNCFPVLEDLSIWRCMKLKSIPDLRSHTSLRLFNIVKCPKMIELRYLSFSWKSDTLC